MAKPAKKSLCKLATLEKSQSATIGSRGAIRVLLGDVLELCPLSDSFTSTIGLPLCCGNLCRVVGLTRVYQDFAQTE